MEIYFCTCVNICRDIYRIGSLFLENPESQPNFETEANSCNFVSCARPYHLPDVQGPAYSGLSISPAFPFGDYKFRSAERMLCVYQEEQAKKRMAYRQQPLSAFGIYLGAGRQRGARKPPSPPNSLRDLL